MSKVDGTEWTRPCPDDVDWTNNWRKIIGDDKLPIVRTVNLEPVSRL
jgi:hypothetical protein